MRKNDMKLNHYLALVLSGAFLLCLATIVSCGVPNQGEYYGDLYESPGAYVLMEGEHNGGWGRTNCFMCHNIENIHLENNSSFDQVDVDAVRQRTIDEGLSSCMTCHGTNGTE